MATAFSSGLDIPGGTTRTAREKSTGVRASIVVKPSYGLTDDQVATMLKESFSHADHDRDARALAEQRVEAASLLEAVGAALGKDCDLLDEGERAEIERGIASVRGAREGTDHRAIKAAVESLNHATEAFAGRRMDRAVSGALAGRRVDEVR